LVNSSVLTISSAPGGRSFRFAFSAAGFIATSTSGASPGVRMSWSAKCSWKLLTPGSVPAGARISAGKFGSVDRSLPKTAVSWVNLSPVSCMPSPESPAKRMITWSSSWTCLVTAQSLLRTPGRRPCAAPPLRPGARVQDGIESTRLSVPFIAWARGAGDVCVTCHFSVAFLYLIVEQRAGLGPWNRAVRPDR